MPEIRRRKMLKFLFWSTAFFAVDIVTRSSILFIPSAGVGLAASLIAGRPALVAVFAGALAACLYGDSGLVFSVLKAAAYAGSIGIAHHLVVRTLGKDCLLYRRRDLWRFPIVAGFIPGAVTALLCETARLVANAAPTNSIPESWIAYAVGYMVVTPICLSYFASSASWSRRRLGVTLPTLFFIGLAFFGRVLVHNQYETARQSLLVGEGRLAAQTIQRELARTDLRAMALSAVLGPMEPADRASFEGIAEELTTGPEGTALWIGYHDGRFENSDVEFLNLEMQSALKARSRVGVIRESAVYILSPVYQSGEPVGCVVIRRTIPGLASLAEQEQSEPVELQLVAGKGLPSMSPGTEMDYSFRALGTSWVLRATLSPEVRTRPKWGLPFAFTLFAYFQLFLIHVSNRAERIETLKGELETRARELEEMNTDLERATKDALSADRAKGVFLANMSHEIRSPLSAILGLTRLIGGDNLTQAQRERLRHVQMSAETLTSVLNSILDFSKIDSGELELRISRHSLDTLLEECVRTFLLAAETKGVRLWLDLDSELPDEVELDGNRVRQVLLNLVGNAVKFTPAGEIKVACAMRGLDGENCRLKFSVSDTGEGISQSKLLGIFDAFTQGDVSESNASIGTGLGLSISKGLLELMGSDMQVESEVGVGSTFSFELEVPIVSWPSHAFPVGTGTGVYLDISHEGRERTLEKQLERWGFVGADTPEKAGLSIQGEESLPLKDLQSPTIVLMGMLGLDKSLGHCSDPEVIPLILPLSRRNLRDAMEQALRGFSRPVVTSPAEPRSYLGKKVLVADDSYTNRLLARALLEPFGIEVDEAENGADAVRKAPTKEYDMIFLDHRMPVLSGAEAAEELRRVRPSTPLVMLTADGMVGGLEDLVDEVLLKPYTESQLAEVLGRYLTPAMLEFQEETLHKAVGGDATAAAAVARSLLEELPEWLQALQGSGSQEERARAAHTLVSGVRVVGMPTLVAAADEYERNALGDHDKEQQQLAIIKQEGESLMKALQNYLGELT